MATKTDIAVHRPAKLVERLSARFGIDPDKMLGTLKNTAFRQSSGVEVSNEQMMALLVVAEQYGLNPWTKEIFAFPDKQNGIVPVVGVDGWSRIINEQHVLDGVSFAYSDATTNAGGKEVPDWCECTIYRKDRDKPVTVREYYDEVKRGTGPWGSHPRRMLRHKTLIQCARIAFGFVGIYDEDEAARIIEGQAVIVEPKTKLTNSVRRAPIDITPEQEPPPASAAVAESTGEILTGLDGFLLDVSQAQTAEDIDYLRSAAAELPEADQAKALKELSKRVTEIKKGGDNAKPE